MYIYTEREREREREITDWTNLIKCEKISEEVDRPKHRQRVQLLFRLYLPKDFTRMLVIS